ncbi:MAG: DNA polymerase I, partial [Gammaproteobacteria bacterium]|nr:DNA polymerase I [Gammaproteobacteria bacterium]
MSNPKRLVLVDGSSYLYRAFHALPPLSNSRGEPTGAIHGVLNMLNRLLKDYEPERVAVVFDARGKTFRDDLFEQYKANRPPMPDDLRGQVEPLLEAVAAMGLPLLRVQGVEADDVIGTLARRAANAGHDTLISTGDKDMAQLVDQHITLVNTMTNKTMDRDGVKEKFDVFPDQIIDYLALVGDSSDNIPGVPKVGPKTAAKWLNQYDTLDNIIVHADEIAGKVGESLRENLVQLELSRKLATIDCDVPLELEPEQLIQSAPDLDALRELYTRLEMNSLLRQLPASGQDTAEASTPEPVATETRYHTVLTLAELKHWKTRLEQAELSALDTETTGLDYMQAELVGLSVSVEPGEAAYIPVAHDYPGAPEQLARDTVLAELKPWLESPEAAKVGHHIKFDTHILARYDIALAGIQHDTMLESYVLDSTATRHDMDSVARKYLGVDTTSFEDVAGKGAKQLTFNQVPLDTAGHYAAEDADITLRLHQAMWEKLQQNQALMEMYRDIEIPLVSVLQHMEHTGVLIDTFMLASQSQELAQRMQELEQQAHEAAGGPFNVASPKQLQEILFERLGLPVIRKTPKGQPSTAEDVLQELAADYPLPRLILEHRSMAKLKSTYTDKLPAQVDKTTGRVHTSYHQAVAATGRLSSSDPN